MDAVDTTTQRGIRMCVRPGCPGRQLAPWWRLCLACTLPLLNSTDLHPRPPGAEPPHRPETARHDQADAAGWDALTWAERIAPHHWGTAADNDLWIQTQRCLVFAAAVTAHGTGCPHIQAAQIPAPVVFAARSPHHQACPPCAEPTVAAHASHPAFCDRCGNTPVDLTDRSALATGTSLIVVAQLCAACRTHAFALTDDLHPDDLT